MKDKNMNKLFYISVFFIFLVTPFFLERIQKFILVEPMMNPCLLQKSKLACLLKVEGVPVRSSCFINEKILENKIKKGLPQWAKNQIREDLSHFPVITKNDLDRYFTQKTDPHNIIVRIKVKNKKAKMIHAAPHSLPQEKMSYLHAGSVLLDVIDYLAKENYISDTDFIISTGDFHRVIGNEVMPLFAFAKDVSIPVEKDLILIPDWQNLGSIYDLRKRIRSTNERIAWEDKKNLLFWRGRKYDSTGFRERFTSFSKKYPKLIDAEFIGIDDKSKVSPFIQPEDHLQYRYLISIDGYRCSWERLIWHLHSNSLVFKHKSDQIQWFYKGIKPFVDYIPVTDEEDTLKYMAWAEKHPKEVQSIIQHSSNFVEENLRLEDMYHYIAVLLEEYSKKLVY